MDEILQIPFAYRLGVLFGLGILIGAVLNWVIYRLSPSHTGLSPWSDAGSDSGARSWFDCVPVLGWLWLRRQPAARAGGFWLRAMFIELGTGALYAGLYWWEVGRLKLLGEGLPPGITPTDALTTILHIQFAGQAVLAALLIAATFIDIDDQVIPDWITVPGTLLTLLLSSVYPWWLLPNELIFLVSGLQGIDFLKLSSPSPWPAWLNGLGDNSPLLIALFCWWLWCFALLPRRWRGRRGFEMALAIFWGRLVRDPFSWLILIVGAAGTLWIALLWDLGPPHWQGLLSSLVGMAVSAGLVWVVRLVGGRIMKQEAMGFGDVTLMALIGAALGWQGGIMVFFLAPVVALVFGIAQILIFRRGDVPYGPFLCAAALGLIFGWGEAWPWAAPIFAFFLQMGWLLSLALILGFTVVLAALLVFVQWIKSMFRRPARPLPPPTSEEPANSTGVG